MSDSAVGHLELSAVERLLSGVVKLVVATFIRLLIVFTLATVIRGLRTLPKHSRRQLYLCQLSWDQVSLHTNAQSTGVEVRAWAGFKLVVMSVSLTLMPEHFPQN